MFPHDLFPVDMFLQSFWPGYPLPTPVLGQYYPTAYYARAYYPYRYYPGKVSIPPPPFRPIFLTGTYSPAESLTGRYAPTEDLTGGYSPAIDLEGS